MNKNKFYVYALLCLGLISYPCIAFESEEEEPAQALISDSPQPEQQPPILLSPHLSGGHDQIESWIDEYIKNFQPDEEAIFDVDAFFKNQPSEETTVIGGALEEEEEEEEEVNSFKSYKIKSLKCQFKRCKCKNEFESSELLKKHIQEQHVDVKRICTYCGKSFAQLSGLTIHERTHTGEKPFPCETCNKSFAKLSDLTRHKRTHTGDKFFKCTIDKCDKSFSRKDDLAKHTRIHTDEKTYKCATCSKSFSGSSHFIRHKRTHTGEKPFKCTIDKCNWSFNDQGNLRKHINSIHEGDKSYRCTSCNKSFAKKQGLQRHQNSKKGCQFQLKRTHDFASKVNPSAPASLDQADASEPSTKIVAIEAPEYEFPEDEFEVVDCDTYPTTTSQQPMLPFFDSNEEDTETEE